MKIYNQVHFDVSRMNVKNLAYYILFKQCPVFLIRVSAIPGERVTLFIRGIRYLYCINFGKQCGFHEL